MDDKQLSLNISDPEESKEVLKKVKKYELGNDGVGTKQKQISVIEAVTAQPEYKEDPIVSYVNPSGDQPIVSLDRYDAIPMSLPVDNNFHPSLYEPIVLTEFDEGYWGIVVVYK